MARDQYPTVDAMMTQEAQAQPAAPMPAGGGAPTDMNPVVEAIRTMAEFVAAQEEQGNPAVGQMKQAMQMFAQAVAQAGPEMAPMPEEQQQPPMPEPEPEETPEMPESDVQKPMNVGKGQAVKESAAGVMRKGKKQKKSKGAVSMNAPIMQGGLKMADKGVNFSGENPMLKVDVSNTTDKKNIEMQQRTGPKLSGNYSQLKMVDDLNQGAKSLSTDKITPKKGAGDIGSMSGGPDIKFAGNTFESMNE